MTVAIVGILAAIAYPSYTNQIAKARRAEMQAELMALAQFMERIYTETGCYNPGADMDCSSGAGEAPDISAADDHLDHYSIAFSGTVTADRFLIQATPISGGAQAADGILRSITSGAFLGREQRRRCNRCRRRRLVTELMLTP